VGVTIFDVKKAITPGYIDVEEYYPPNKKEV